MPQQFDKTNTGSLWLDDRGRWSGTLNVDGVEYFLDVYGEKQTRSGKTVRDVKVKRKDVQRPMASAGGGGRSGSAWGDPDPSDDLPF